MWLLKRFRRRVPNLTLYGNVEVLSTKAAALSFVRLRLPSRRTILRMAPFAGLFVLLLVTDSGSINWTLIGLFVLVVQTVTFVRDRFRERVDSLDYPQAGVGLSVRHYAVVEARSGPGALVVLANAQTEGGPDLDEFPTIYVSPRVQRVRAVKMNGQWHEAREVAR